jgi:hypothetical protein
MLFLSNTDIPSSINNTLALGKIATYEIAILKANSIINLSLPPVLFKIFSSWKKSIFILSFSIVIFTVLFVCPTMILLIIFSFFFILIFF